jgi:hypothetical protein
MQIILLFSSMLIASLGTRMTRCLLALLVGHAETFDYIRSRTIDISQPACLRS